VHDGLGEGGRAAGLGACARLIVFFGSEKRERVVLNPNWEEKRRKKRGSAQSS